MVHSPSKKSRKQSQKSQKTRYRSIPNDDQIIWGIHSVMEALKASPQYVREVFIDEFRKGKRHEDLLEIVQQNRIQLTIERAVSEGTNKKKPSMLDQEGSQGVSARVAIPALTLDELLVNLNNNTSTPLLLALDSIQDPHNLGAIIRSAVAAGVNGLILPKDRSASITGTVIKVSAGGVFHIDICRVTNLVNCFKILKKEDIWIFGTARDSSTSVYQADLTVPACLVIGSEGKGLRPLVAEHCDMFVSIPMQGSLDSLNASVAAGIILFEAVRQRAG